MRCRAIGRLISDEIDGCLAPGRRRRLEKHLASCRSCREYGEWLRSFKPLSAKVKEPAVPPGYWEDSIIRLRATLEPLSPRAGRIKEGRRLIPVPSLRWAWAAAPALLAVAAGVYFGFFGPSGRLPESFPLSDEDGAGRVVALIGADEGLEADFSDLIQAAILDESGEPDGDIRRLLYADSRFLDGLSDDELQRLDSHLATELKI